MNELSPCIYKIVFHRTILLFGIIGQAEVSTYSKPPVDGYKLIYT